MLSSSRQAQQAGLGRRRVTDYEETLQGRRAVTHHNLHRHKPHQGKKEMASPRRFCEHRLDGIYLYNEATGKEQRENESPPWSCFQVLLRRESAISCSVDATLTRDAGWTRKVAP